ncbi:N-acetylglucosamine-6-phosphate deacetylase [Arthrobacter oryzae]|uniref:N-acetylglucosamine-6-phosphate deacetylase n=1 Tax=Arthrobacter oryzae TaxID=409290 RepID=UPI00273BE91E|nr:N-acetylglucosamine-6-phosphate deacetylase [Arthrobacter oryzae]WLQ05715.1 N-acetylglucosamine-6-phosphate deacetylase [Arthrobacter oryzae]
MGVLIHNATALDANGRVDNAWVHSSGKMIAATGVGGGWTAEKDDVILDASGAWLVPGFIDLHVHGGGGHSFHDDGQSIQKALAAHRTHGTTRSLISLVTTPPAAVRQQLETISTLMAHDSLILGAHLEGPFLSPLHKGAHDPQLLMEPAAQTVQSLLETSNGVIRQITLAPELPGAADAIDRFVEAGIIVAIGHTDVDYDGARKAFDQGARLLTHGFNAMRGIHHRHPGPVLAAFDDPRIVIELIADGIHIDPRVISMAFQQAPGRIALVTDAMAAAGSANGTYRLGSQPVEVKGNRAVLTGTDTIAGSTLTQDRALAYAIDTVGLQPAAAVAALTQTPARALGLENEFGLLSAGYRPDFVLLDHHWNVQGVWADGERLTRA